VQRPSIQSGRHRGRHAADVILVIVGRMAELLGVDSGHRATDVLAAVG